MASHFLRELLSLGLDIIDGTSLGNKSINTWSKRKRDTTHHVERRFWKRVVLAGKDLFERANGLLQRDELALIAGEYLGDLEGL